MGLCESNHNQVINENQGGNKYDPEIVEKNFIEYINRDDIEDLLEKIII